MSVKKAIVTGASGFIGNAVCAELAARGIEVIAAVRRGSERSAKMESEFGIRIVESDLSEFGSLDERIPDRDADVLFHFAWTGSAGALRGDGATQLDNVRYTLDTVKACRKLNCGRFVFASSVMEYETAALMKTEAEPGIGTLYGSAKIAANYMARATAAHLGVTYLPAVISNVYGPGEDSPRLLNTALRKLLRGEHCSFSPGNQLYDFIYITDAAKAFVAIGEKGRANRTYYIGSLNPKPLKELLLDMRNQVNPSIRLGIGELPFTGVSLTYQEFDIYALRDDTGFTPEVRFADGIQKTIQWLKEAESCRDFSFRN